MNARAVCFALSVVYFALCCGVVWLTTGWVRGSAGDLLIVALLTHILGVLYPKRVGWRAGACLALALVLEGGQLLGKVDADSPRWMHIIFGSTPDPLDAALYVLSAGLGVAGEWLLIRRPESD